VQGIPIASIVEAGPDDELLISSLSYLDFTLEGDLIERNESERSGTRVQKMGRDSIIPTVMG
jgi:hypothetical protein